MALPHQPPHKRIRTDGFACYSVAFSPFYPAKLAVAGAANFGLVGNGRLSVVNQDASPAGMGAGGMVFEKGRVDYFRSPRSRKRFDTQDGLYDLAWSEMNENQIATGSGDGSVKLWDVMLNDFPIRKWHEHQREVFSVDWSNTQKELFCTSSWDGTIKIWTPDRPSSLTTIPAHSACVYSALFSPSQPSIIASCSSDGTLKLWDTRSPLPSAPAAPGQPALATPQLAIPAHPGAEILDLDFNKYAPHLIATGSVDRTVKVHDVRMAASSPASPPSSSAPYLQPNSTVATLLGHEYAVRRVAWSPHSSALLATGSYDMTARIWSVNAGGGAGGGPIAFSAQGGMGAKMERVWDQHKEFVVGVAWSFFEEGVVASCSWDQEVHLWQ